MLESLVRLVAGLAFSVAKSSKINRVFERSGSGVLFDWSSGVVEHRVADVAVIPDDLAGIAYMLAIMTAETTGRIKMSDVVRMRLPISLHFGKEIGLKDALNLPGARLYRLVLAGIKIRIIAAVELVHARRD